MLWFDTHCHLDLIPDRPEKIVADAAKVGVDRIIVPGVKGWPDKTQKLLELQGVALAWGVHPMFIDLYHSKNARNICVAGTDKPIAIGECGLDRRSNFSIDEQSKLFEWQLELAAFLKLPAIIHLVGHSQLAFDLIKKHNVRGVIHGCSCSTEMALRFAEIGCKISLSALHLTNDKKRQLCQSLPDDAILIETDAPDFKPTNWPMDYNHPAALPGIATELARERSICVEAFAQQVYYNAVEFFGL